jgi:hypothetical protein
MWSSGTDLLTRPKCDQSRPSCINCGTADLCCEYRIISPPSTSASTPAGIQQDTTRSPEPIIHYPSGNRVPDIPTPQSSSQTGPSIQSSGGENSHSAFIHGAPSEAEKPRLSFYSRSSKHFQENFTHQPGINMVDLELFYQYSHGIDGLRSSSELVMKQALAAPYLMNELLAVSALYFSVTRPQQREFYHNKATELQTCALSLFNNLPNGYATENIIPTFLFSSSLGAHTLFDALLFRPTDFTVFIDRFVGCLRLHRGIHTIIIDSWDWLQHTEIHGILNVKDRQETDIEPGTDCAALIALIQSADLSQRSIDACQASLKDLQWMFDLAKLRDTQGSGPSETELILAWLVRMPPEFADLLLLRKPEALAILAHYAVLLHWRRDLWLINDGGKFLIDSITGYLGSSWQPWLELPALALVEGYHPTGIRPNPRPGNNEIC